MKKILVIYATYGSGHKAIANYIKDYYLSQNPNLDIKTMDIIDYSKTIGRLSKRVSEKLMLRLPGIWSVLFKWADHKYTSRFTNKVSLKWFNRNEIEDEIIKFNPDLVLSTHFYGSCFVTDLKKKNKINPELVTIITDYEAHNIWLDHYSKDEYIVVPSKEEKRCLSTDIPKKNIKTFGIPIFPKEEELNEQEEILKKLKLNPKKLTCVCFSGGGNGSTATIPYIKALLKAKQDINYIFISGNNKKAYDKINRLVNKYNVKDAKVYGYVNNVPELLVASDFVITKPGGAQSTECLYFKKPMLFIKSSGGQENYNIKYFTKSGYARFFRHPKKIYKYMIRLDRNITDIKRLYKNLSKADNTKAMKQLYSFSKELLK
jgi:processive 1,2-diacylglycerol beta-glucosyltransferase